jgi:hypothetical protein
MPAHLGQVGDEPLVLLESTIEPMPKERPDPTALPTT